MCQNRIDAELQSVSSSLTYASLPSKCVRAVSWGIDYIVSGSLLLIC